MRPSNTRAVPAGPTPATVSTGARGGSCVRRCDPGTSRVAPFSSVKSLSIHMTFIVSGMAIERGVYPWSECSTIAAPPGPVMLAVWLDRQ
jgi:hypothetical protein